MDNQRIGEFIRQLRKEREMTQKDVAEVLHITDRAVSKWERGLNAPDIALLEPLAQVLMKLGVKRGLVVYGQDKLDEISLSAPTTVCELADGNYRTYEVTPEQLGLERCRKSDLTGGTPAENAAITRAILDGSEKGHKRCPAERRRGAVDRRQSGEPRRRCFSRRPAH